ATFRAPKSAKVYKELWTKEGSPLLVYGNKVRELLQKEVGNEVSVYLAMRYQNPSIKSVLTQLKKDGITEIVAIPLYPQYASSSTKSSIEKVKEVLKKMNYQPKVTFIENFLDRKSTRLNSSH